MTPRDFFARRAEELAFVLEKRPRRSSGADRPRDGAAYLRQLAHAARRLRGGHSWNERFVRADTGEEVRFPLP